MTKIREPAFDHGFHAENFFDRRATSVEWIDRNKRLLRNTGMLSYKIYEVKFVFTNDGMELNDVGKKIITKN